MSSGFRHRQAWLHTWAGLLAGSVLFAIFWMGTLSVFDREIDRWMMPATRLGPAPEPLSLDRIVLPLLDRLPPQTQWQVMLPDDRDPTLRLIHADAGGKRKTMHVDPATGAVLPDPGTLAGSGFIYPFHYTLQLRTFNLGYWLVGLASMAMLVLLVSGIVIHARLIGEFFVFRPWKSRQRAGLDLHNLTGVLALPFHFVITLSGLVIFFAIYFPSNIDVLYPGDKPTFFADAFGLYHREKSSLPGGAPALDQAVSQAQRDWQLAGRPGRPASLRVMHPGDANAYVEIYRSGSDRISAVGHTVYVDAATGALLHRSHPEPVFAVQRFISGLHLLHFDHWTLRWLYFLAGLSGCLMIGTGFIFWLEARRKRHARQGLAGVRVVDGLAAGSITGIIVATFAFFVINRLLPQGTSFAGQERAELEVWVFYLAWIGTFLHAYMRPARAWSEQLLAIIVLALGSVVLNWITTDRVLMRSVLAMDLTLLFAAALAAWCFVKTRRGEIALAAQRTETCSLPSPPSSTSGEDRTATSQESAERA